MFIRKIQRQRLAQIVRFARNLRTNWRRQLLASGVARHSIQDVVVSDPLSGKDTALRVRIAARVRATAIDRPVRSG